jgi:membrane-bound lytic murein transglycosylase
MRTKQVRPEKKEFEYSLDITRETDTLSGKDYILFDFQTVKEFITYEYKIDIIPSLNKNKNQLTFKIEGLSAPVISFSHSGTAGYQYKFYDFENKDYELLISNNKKQKNQFKMKLKDSEIKILKSSNDKNDKFINITIK